MNNTCDMKTNRVIKSHQLFKDERENPLILSILPHSCTPEVCLSVCRDLTKWPSLNTEVTAAAQTANNRRLKINKWSAGGGGESQPNFSPIEGY